MMPAPHGLQSIVPSGICAHAAGIPAGHARCTLRMHSVGGKARWSGCLKLQLRLSDLLGAQTHGERACMQGHNALVHSVLQSMWLGERFALGQLCHLLSLQCEYD